MENLRVIRKVLTGAWLVLSVVACSQIKEEPMTIQNPEINAQQNNKKNQSLKHVLSLLIE